MVIEHDALAARFGERVPIGVTEPRLVQFGRGWISDGGSSGAIRIRAGGVEIVRRTEHRDVFALDHRLKTVDRRRRKTETSSHRERIRVAQIALIRVLPARADVK